MKASSVTYWRGFANGTHTGPFNYLLLGVLIPLSLPYALIQRLRTWCYQAGILRSHTLPRPVISIGNITVGGTGKTPVAAYIAHLLLTQGLKVAVLSRGYGGSLEGTTAVVSDGSKVLLSAEECGDEPFLLASTVPGLMVVIGSNRHSAGLMAMERLSPDIFLLDDGFQHLRLKRDLNILLLDARKPFGNGWCLPAGLLREPRSACSRADLVIRTRCPKNGSGADPVSGIPMCNAHHELGNAVPLTGGEPLQLDSLRDKRILAFAGIADPHAFFDGLRAHGMNLVSTQCLPDHSTYTPADIAALADTVASSGADYAITTEKDGVKLRHLPVELAQKVLLAKLTISIDDPTPLNTALRNLLQK